MSDGSAPVAPDDGPTPPQSGNPPSPARPPETQQGAPHPPITPPPTPDWVQPYGRPSPADPYAAPRGGPSPQPSRGAYGRPYPAQPSTWAQPDPTQPYANQPYASQPYATPPYSASPGGRHPLTAQPPYGQPYVPPASSRANGAATASLVTGIVAVILSALPSASVFGLTLGLIAVGLGASGIRRARLAGGKGVAIGGTVVGVFATVLGLVVALVAIQLTEGRTEARIDDRGEVSDEAVDRTDRGQATPTDPSPSLLENVRGPQGSTPSGGIPVGPEGIAGSTAGAAPDAVVVTVYLDYLCPYCRQFEELNGPTLDALRADGQIVVEYHPVSILDRFSQGSGYSTRTATAVAHVADLAPEAFVAFSTALFVNQPAEGTTGLTDAEIAAVARGAAVPEAVATTIESGEYLTAPDAFVAWVRAATEQGDQDLGGRLATPTVLIDDAPLIYNWSMPGALEQAIAEARG